MFQGALECCRAPYKKLGHLIRLQGGLKGSRERLIRILGAPYEDLGRLIQFRGNLQCSGMS